MEQQAIQAWRVWQTDHLITLVPTTDLKTHRTLFYYSPRTRPNPALDTSTQSPSLTRYTPKMNLFISNTLGFGDSAWRWTKGLDKILQNVIELNNL
jgi:hypothetical protein